MLHLRAKHAHSRHFFELLMTECSLLTPILGHEAVESCKKPTRFNTLGTSAHRRFQVTMSGCTIIKQRQAGRRVFKDGNQTVSHLRAAAWCGPVCSCARESARRWDIQSRARPTQVSGAQQNDRSRRGNRQKVVLRTSRDMNQRSPAKRRAATNRMSLQAHTASS